MSPPSPPLTARPQSPGSCARKSPLSSLKARVRPSGRMYPRLDRPGLRFSSPMLARKGLFCREIYRTPYRRQSCLQCNLAVPDNLRRERGAGPAESARARAETGPAPSPSHLGLATPGARRLQADPDRRVSDPPGGAPSAWTALPQLSPFSKKLITARVPVAAAKPASGPAAEAPAGE